MSGGESRLIPDIPPKSAPGLLEGEDRTPNFRPIRVHGRKPSRYGAQDR